MTVLELSLGGGAIALGLLVAAVHARSGKIPNLLTLPGAGFALAVGVALGEPKHHLIGFGAALVAGLLLFAARVFPGGAAKLLFVFGAALGWPAALIVPATALLCALPSRLRARPDEARDPEAPLFALPLPMTLGAGLTLGVQALLAA